MFANPVQWILSIILILSSLGVITARKPVHAALFFLLTLVTLGTYYLQLSAEFIAVMQVLVYAGAIMVIFMYVIVLFQDAHAQLAKYEAESSPYLLWTAGSILLLALLFLWEKVIGLKATLKPLPEGFGMVESLGHYLYIDFFFPFEAVLLLFLVAIIGALYIGKKVID